MPLAQATPLPAPLTILALLVLTAIVVVLARSVLGARARRRRIRRAVDRGHEAEMEAPRALARRGFRVLRRHPRGALEWRLNGEPRRSEVEADLLVSRAGQRYVVEVKTGRGTRPTKRDTRRQLLEYTLAYDVDGVLLLDADADTLHRVEFPTGRGRPANRIAWFIAGVAVGLAAVMLTH